MSDTTEEDLSEKMSELYVAECNAAKARLEVETECRRIIADNYEKVLVQAKEFSKKIEAPHLAKVCQVGYFVDAHVVRTNQLTMEMGASYYAECSIHTAEKVLSRRIAEMRKNREDGLESIRMLDDKIKFAKENFSAISIDGGPMEIVEKYDEEMEKLFYENRKKKISEKAAESKKEPKETKEKEKKAKTDKEHEEMMKKLEELEQLELENEEIIQETIQEQEAPPPQPFEIPLEEVDEDEEVELNERLLAQPGVSQKEMERLLEFLDACDAESSDEEDEEIEEESEEDGEEKENKKVEELDSDDYASDEEIPKAETAPTAPKTKNVTPKVVEIEETTTTTVKRKRSGVRFSAQLEAVKTFRQDDTVEIKTEEKTAIIETKSILRNTEPTPVDRSALEPEQKELAAMSTVTFPGEIVEKNPYECEPSTSKDPAPVITEKKVSKFRASRHRN